MALFNQDYIVKMRYEFMNNISDFQYEIDNSGQWNDATEQNREVDGNYIRFTVAIPNQVQTAHTITGLRILGDDRNVIAQRDLSIVVNATQIVLFVLRISYQEV